MNWGNTKESSIDLLLTLGVMIIILGFIDLFVINGWALILSGVVVTAIGIVRATKDMKEKGITPDWEKKKNKKSKNKRKKRK